MNEVLISRDSHSKIRVIQISCQWYPELQSFIIERFSGLLDGKMTKQPIIEINKGKAKRTISEQAKLEFNSHVKKYLDKGYKRISDFGYKTLNEFKPHIEEIFPKDKTDANNVLKPMLCKVYDPNDKKNQNKTWYASTKCDGVRCMIFQKDGIIKTSSRGGQNYDIASTYIRNDSGLKKIFELYPDIILDGEIYKHHPNWKLSRISGLCRLETLHDDHKKLLYYCYDIVDESKTFKERLSIINKLSSIIESNSKIIFVNHTLVSNNDEIDELHDQFVNDGYEGLVIRDPDEKYKSGARDRRMQKIKKFTDDDFKIVDLVEGLRDEDMCFLMETKEGYQFKAKPIGDRALKQYYRENIDNIKGEIGVVKYFGYTNTEHPVPNLPVFLTIRNKKDVDE